MDEERRCAGIGDEKLMARDLEDPQKSICAATVSDIEGLGGLEKVGRSGTIVRGKRRTRVVVDAKQG